MADLLCVGTCATNDPTKAAFPFITATGAIANGTDVAIALLGEAAYLMKDEIAQTVHPVGFPPLTDLMAQVAEAKVPIYV
jgi:predicted peroxiredoxin